MISYEPLYDTLKRKGLTQKALIEKGVNPFVSINRGSDLDVPTMNSICKILECEIKDVVCYVDGDRVKRDKSMHSVNWSRIEQGNISLSKLATMIGKSKSALAISKRKGFKLTGDDITKIADILKCEFKELISD